MADPNTDEYMRTEVPHWCQIDIWQQDDFHEAVPQMVDPITGEPIDLDSFSELRFDLWIRSEFDNEGTEIAFLTSAANEGIIFDDRAKGLISIHRTQTIVETWPLGSWVHWLNMNWTEPGSGAIIKTIWRGPFIIHRGRL
jgi:hypothetical protein